MSQEIETWSRALRGDSTSSREKTVAALFIHAPIGVGYSRSPPTAGESTSAATGLG